MTLHELIDGLGLCLTCGDGAVVVTDLTDDSRSVVPGAVFVARCGVSGDGQRYVREALRRGAVAVIADSRLPADLVGANAHYSLAVCASGEKIDQRLAGRLAQRFFGHPSKQLRLIGITGTNGKTTTAFLIQYLLKQAGYRCGMIGTVGVDDGVDRTAGRLTTPGAIEFSRQLARMVAKGCRAVVVEVSSHALDQGRTDAVDWEVAVFTNLTGDHLDYHGDMDRYAAAKARLFAGLPEAACAVVNHNDAYATRMLQDCLAKVIRYGVIAEDQPGGSEVLPDCRGEVLRLGCDHSLVRLHGPWGSVEARLGLVGRHNVVNVLGAVAAVDAMGIPLRNLADGLAGCPTVPGRLEPVRLSVEEAGKALAPGVLVDYAHTHDALDNVLQTVRKVTQGRLTVVFGCGGDRDRSKRPKMAAVACRWADRVIVTSDNPRTEDPAGIIHEVLQGVPATASGRVTVEVDRARAIAIAVREAADRDTVVLAGKGHEDYQIVGTQRHPFDDRCHAQAALRKRLGIPVSKV